MKYALLAALAVAVGIVAVRRVTVSDNSDFDGFHRAGAAVWAGADPHADKAVRRYLPCFPLLMAPLGALPLGVAAAGWYLLNAAACWGTWRELERLLGAGQGRALALAAVLGAPFWIDGLVMGQVNPVLVYLMTRAFGLLAAGRDGAAGAWLGLAVALKVTPALLVFHAAWRLRWRAVGAALAVLVALAVLAPAAVWGPARTAEIYRGWADEALLGGVAGEDAATGRSVRFNNQSIPAWTARLLTDAEAGTRSGRFSVNVAALSPDAARAVALGLLAVLGLGLLAAWGKPGPAACRAATLPGEGALAIGGTVLFSPIAWTSHFQAMVPVLALLARRALGADSAGRRAARIALVVLAVTLVGLASRWTRALGCPLLGALAAWGIAAELHRRGALAERPA